MDKPFRLSDMQNLVKPYDFAHEIINIEPPRNYLLADYQYEIIMKSIADFEQELKPNEEIALKMACFGQTVILHVTDIGYSNPSLIHFYGHVNDQKATIIQHINQLSFMMLAVPVINPNTKPRRIGFRAPGDED